MNHKLKTTIFKILGVLPDFVGYKIYHSLQNLSENKNLNYKIKSGVDTYDSFASILKKLNYSLENKVIAEIGSGWLPIMPYFFIFKGKAKEIITYDLNEHFQKKNIENFNNRFSESQGEKLVIENKKYALPKQIKYFAKTNIINNDLSNVDIVFSRFVLEHVTPKDLNEMHKKFKSIKPGTLIVHYISPSDHRSYTDHSLSLQDFLKYSEVEWNKIQTKFDYHNRYRLPQYLEVFKQNNLTIEYIEHDNVKEDSEQFKKFNQLNIHEDFKKYSTEELTAGSIIVVLKV
jgi:tRNA A58 N-methylase Trm61